MPRTTPEFNGLLAELRREREVAERAEIATSAPTTPPRDDVKPMAYFCRRCGVFVHVKATWCGAPPLRPTCRRCGSEEVEPRDIPWSKVPKPQTPDPKAESVAQYVVECERALEALKARVNGEGERPREPFTPLRDELEVVAGHRARVRGQDAQATGAVSTAVGKRSERIEWIKERIAGIADDHAELRREHAALERELDGLIAAQNGLTQRR